MLLLTLTASSNFVKGFFLKSLIKQITGEVSVTKASIIHPFFYMSFSAFRTFFFFFFFFLPNSKAWKFCKQRGVIQVYFVRYDSTLNSFESWNIAFYSCWWSLNLPWLLITLQLYISYLVLHSEDNTKHYFPWGKILLWHFFFFWASAFGTNGRLEFESA